MSPIPHASPDMLFPTHPPSPFVWRVARTAGGHAPPATTHVLPAPSDRVDGNGVLHPRGFGLASHLGVTADIPTVGVAKNLHCVDGLDKRSVRAVMAASPPGAAVPLRGYSGAVLGAAVCAAPGTTKPLYVSVGHRMALDTSVALVRRCCRFRVPEPVRLADQSSRAWIREHPNFDDDADPAP